MASHVCVLLEGHAESDVPRVFRIVHLAASERAGIERSSSAIMTGSGRPPRRTRSAAAMLRPSPSPKPPQLMLRRP